MAHELVGVVRLVHATWRGDLTRSVTGSPVLTTGLEALLALVVSGWLALSLTMVTPGPVAVPVPAQIQLLDDSVEGAALVSACIACVCTVLMPVSRALTTMLAVVPLSPVTRAMGTTVPLLAISTVGGPVVVAPLLAGAIRLSEAPIAVSAVLLVPSAALAAALAASAVIRVLAAAASAWGLTDVVGTTVSTAATLLLAGLSVAGLRAMSMPTAAEHGHWPLTLRAASVVLALAAATLVFLASSLLRDPVVPGAVRLLARRGRTIARRFPVAVDLLLWVRDPTALSTLLLMTLLVLGTWIASERGAAWSEALTGPLLLGVPCALGLVHYGTDRTTSWRRSTVRPIRYDGWAAGRVAQGITVALAGTVPAAMLLLPPDLGSDGPQVRSLVVLAASAGVIAGVLVPSDLELPGAALLAALVAALLVGFPMWMVPQMLDLRQQPIAVLGVAVGLMLLAPMVIQARRRRAVCA
ncbi:hypothetical protein [Curtobacterium sp. MCBD17_023]|uniref:hypothetical protein n=1 Tax=Curtobacterium sp. MCBD17_023 TaxID=2175657 RepID=UPI000D8A6707|nr:hypothetical protein [Curtobacterium sp. MCBD17_023]PYY45754.1 hypothetical protein DEI84_14125 [Curtobacterium sp. MCBD17_023]